MVQNKFTDENRTKNLIKLGFTPALINGFQIHELLNLIPENISFKKSFHKDGTVFIDWQKKTRFFIRITHFMNNWGYGLVSYNNHRLSDQGQSGDQFVDLLADLIIYLCENAKLKIRKKKV